jgi:segregation and condensation protein A
MSTEPTFTNTTSVDNLPPDLYVPPNALQIFLTGFEGPLDLLLYLIQHQNFNILDIPIAEITRQYLQYITLMQQLNLDLAAEYLVMASTLMKLKSSLLLPPRPNNSATSEPETLRSQLMQQLQEYAQYKQAAQDLAALPQVGQDIFLTQVALPELPKTVLIPNIPWATLLQAMREVMARASLFTTHHIWREPLSVRERMSAILEQLKFQQQLDFNNLFTIAEGRAGVIVSLLASLELTKESLIYMTQTQPFESITIHLGTKPSVENPSVTLNQ